MDLGASQTVCNVTLSWEGAYGKAFHVLGSDNGTHVDARCRRSPTAPAARSRSRSAARPATCGSTCRPVRPATASRCGRCRSRRRAPPTTRPDDRPGHRTRPAPPTARSAIAGSQGNWALLVNGQNWVDQGRDVGPGTGRLPAARGQPQGDRRQHHPHLGHGRRLEGPLRRGRGATGMRTVAGFWLAPGGGPGSGGCPNYVTDADLQGELDERHRHLGHGVQGQPRRAHVERRQRVPARPGQLLLGRRARGAAHRLRDVRQRRRQADPPDRPDPPGDVDRRLDRRVAVLQGQLARPGPLRPEQPTTPSATPRRPGSRAATPSRTSSPRAARPASGRSRTTPTACPTRAPTQQNADGYTRAWNCIKAHPGVALGATLFHYGNEGDFGGIWFNVKPGNNKRLSYYAIAKAYGGPAGAAGVNTPPDVQLDDRRQQRRRRGRLDLHGQRRGERPER